MATLITQVTTSRHIRCTCKPCVTRERLSVTSWTITMHESSVRIKTALVALSSITVKKQSSFLAHRSISLSLETRTSQRTDCPLMACSSTKSCQFQESGALSLNANLVVSFGHLQQLSMLIIRPRVHLIKSMLPTAILTSLMGCQLLSRTPTYKRAILS